jgi:hypothetical protein
MENTMIVSRTPIDCKPFNPYVISIEVTSYSEAYALKTMMRKVIETYPNGTIAVDAQKVIDCINEDLKV